MAVENITATKRGVAGVQSHGFGGTVKALCATAEVDAAASTTSTYDFGNIPANARILAISLLSWDDLQTTGSPTFDLGLFAVDDNITDDDNALVSGAAISSAGTQAIPTDVANYGKEAWEFVSGQSTDPGGLLNVKGTIKTTNIDLGGTVTLELYYIID